MPNPGSVSCPPIEPGLIRTKFGEAAETALRSGASGNGSYRAFNDAVARGTRDLYEKGPLAKLGGDPDQVARVIQRAIEERDPKARYKVTASAHLLMGARKAMGDRLWDMFLRSQFPQPGETTPGEPAPHH
jgi:hypothetical protein